MEKNPPPFSFCQNVPYCYANFLYPPSSYMYQSVTSRSREFPFPGILHFFSWFRNRSRKILVPKKSGNRSRKILVPKKNIGTSLEIFQNISVDLGPGLVPFPGFLQFFYGIGTGPEKNLVLKKVLEPVSKKFGTEKKSWNRSRKNLVPKKVSESVPKKFGTGKKSRNRYRSDFGSRHTLICTIFCPIILL